MSFINACRKYSLSGIFDDGRWVYYFIWYKKVLFLFHWHNTMTMEQPVDIKYCIRSCNEGMIPSHEWFNPFLSWISLILKIVWIMKQEHDSLLRIVLSCPWWAWLSWILGGIHDIDHLGWFMPWKDLVQWFIIPWSKWFGSSPSMWSNNPAVGP